MVEKTFDLKTFDLKEKLLKNETVYFDIQGNITNNIFNKVNTANINFVDFCYNKTVTRVLNRIYAFVVSEYEYFIVRKYLPDKKELVNDILKGYIKIDELADHILWSVKNNNSFKNAKPLVDLEDLQIDIECIIDIFTSGAYKYQDIINNSSTIWIVNSYTECIKKNKL